MTEETYADTSQRFQATLDHLQFGQELDDAKIFLVEEEPLDPASLVSRRLLVLQLGYILNRTVVLKPAPDLAHAECHRPVANFTYDDIAHLPAAVASFDVEQREQVVRFDFPSFWANKRLRRYFYPWVPPDFASLKCPRLIFDGETLTRLVLPEELSAEAEEAKTSIGFDEPTIGLHVGAGDDASESPDASLDMLLTHVHGIMEKSDARRVLVTGANGRITVGDATVEEAVHRLQEEGVDTIVPSTDADHPWGALIDLEFLSACDWVVGRVTADAPRIAAARVGLRTFRCDRHRLVSSRPDKTGMRRIFARK